MTMLSTAFALVHAQPSRDEDAHLRYLAVPNSARRTLYTCRLSVKNSVTLFRVSSCWMISSPSFSLWAPAVRRLWGGSF